MKWPQNVVQKLDGNAMEQAMEWNGTLYPRNFHIHSHVSPARVVYDGFVVEAIYIAAPGKQIAI